MDEKYSVDIDEILDLKITKLMIKEIELIIRLFLYVYSRLKRLIIKWNWVNKKIHSVFICVMI